MESMAMLPINDPGFMDSIITAVAGLLGAVIGGIGTYLAARAQYRIERDEKTNSALTSILSELLRNQPTLVRELDAILPLWLTRKHNESAHIPTINELCSLPIYSTRIYDEFFRDIISSRYSEEIETYYSRLRSLNYISEKHIASKMSARDFAENVKLTTFSISLADDLINEIWRVQQNSLKTKWGRERSR